MVQLVDSDFLNGLGYKEGTYKAIEALEKIKQGKGKQITVCAMLFFRVTLLGRAFQCIM
jgi:hypothetical protein